MPGIGDYIHYHTKNYELFGTTQEGPSNYAQGVSSLSARASALRKQAWALHQKYDSAKLKDLERFMNSIFYPGDTSQRSVIEQQQFEQMKRYVESRFEEEFNGFAINWEQGLSVYVKGNKNIGKGTHVSTLNKVYNQLQSALGRVASAKTKAKIEEAQLAIKNALNYLQNKKGIDSNSAVTIGKHLENSDDLIGIVNAALRATMYNNAAVGYVFELALAAFSGQMSDQVGKIAADEVNKALQGAKRSNPYLRIDNIDKTFFDEELFGKEINKGRTNMGVWQRTPDGTAFQFSAPTQDKLDVALSFDGEMYNITAKNYANITQRDIHIVSGTSLLAMILDDDIDFINHYLNITSTYPGVRGNTLTLAHEVMKLNILLKSLTGLGMSGDGGIADILVVNDRNSRHIYVRSIGYLVTKISYRLDRIDEYMKIHGLGKGASLNIKNDFIGDKNIPSDAQAKVRITKLLAQLHNTKISVSIKGKAITDLSQ